MSDAVSGSAAGGPAPSAMWLWCSTPAEAPEVISFVAERQVRTVFLGIGWNGPEPHVIKLADRLRAAGVEVQCLGGDNCWLEQPERASQWLARALTAWGFNAVHLDVEPWTMPGWKKERVRLFEQYLNVLSVVREAGLPLEVDVAPRLATDLAGTRRVLDAVLRVAERVTVLAYRDHAEGVDGILDLSRPARVTCFRHATAFRIGVETQPAAKAGGSRLTFAEEGRIALERETAVVSRRLGVGVDPFYLGVAVHDWRNWRSLA